MKKLFTVAPLRLILIVPIIACNLTGTQSVETLPDVAIPQETPDTMVCEATINHTTSLFAAPSQDAAIVSQVAGADIFTATARTADNWYRLDYPGVDGGAWIGGELVTLSEGCNLPLVDG